jgi:tetratricopeptide (TPR) repeat protein
MRDTINGSVDEAARNSSHELVITFADQQQSLSRNDKLYQLFREAAVNGPIIFCGFSFRHPGASSKGTSPEFLMLQDIIREMGPVGRWHYCVTPFDSKSIESQLIYKKLQAAHIQVINATFGEFMNAIFKDLQSTACPLEKRAPIVVPVGHSSIQVDADEYAKDKRHFEFVGSHLDELTPPSISESLNGLERWSSFFNRHFIERLCKNSLLSELEYSIKKAPEIISIISSPGWGKTFLLRDIAVELYRKGLPILWLNPYSTMEVKKDEKSSIITGTWDALRIDRVIGLINDKAKEVSLEDGKGTPIIISDNCPERIDEVLYLFKYLTNNNRRFVLLIAARSNEFEIMVQENPVLSKGRVFCPEESYDSREEVRKLIDFCTKNKVATIENDLQREVVTQQIISSEADTSIILALQIIFDKQHRPFNEIIKGIWQYIKGEDSQKLILRVASLHRFGSAFYPRLYSLLRTFPPHTHSQVLDAYNDCIKKGILFEVNHDEEPCVHTLHSLIAEQITKVSGKTPAQVDDELLLLAQQMTNNNLRDLEIIRHLLKQINAYGISLSSEKKIEGLFQIATNSTNEDWVVCQQFSNYLLKRGEHEAAFSWAECALSKNPGRTVLHHQKGNVLRRWGMKLKLEGKFDDADKKFQDARKFFTLSRIGSDENEYGYVTHLDMLLYLINETHNEIDKVNLIAEGAQLYKEGLRVIPPDKYNLLLEHRFHEFDLKGDAIDELCKKIEKAIPEGKSSAYASTFLAEQIYKSGDYTKAIDMLKKQREFSENSVLVWVKEAEFHAKEGKFDNASKCIHSAKMREKLAENAEVLWSLMYWDLIIAVIMEDYKDAKIVAEKLLESNFFSKQWLPRGYIWNEIAKQIPPHQRSFKEHSKIWSGVVQNYRSAGRYGVIRMTNAVGDTFHIQFNPKYFSRRDIRTGDIVKFAITILPNGLRAENIESKPFANTVDDIFVKR